MDIKKFKQSWIKENEIYFVNARTGDVMEKFAKDYHAEQLRLCGVVGQSEQLISYSNYLHKRGLLNVRKDNIPTRVKLYVKRD
jgi:hypothetical protein